MELDIIENKKNEAEFLIKGERHSFQYAGSNLLGIVLSTR